MMGGWSGTVWDYVYLMGLSYEFPGGSEWH